MVPRQQRAPRRSRRRSSSRAPRPGARGSCYCRPRLPRPDARRRCRSTATRSSATGFGPLLPGCDAGRRSATSTRSSASSRAGDVAAFVVEPVQGKGVNLPPPGYLRGRAGALPRSRRAVRVRRGPDRARAAPAASWRSSTGAWSRTWSASPRRCPAATCRSAPCSLTPAVFGRGLRRDGARRRATARRSAATTSPRRPGWPRCGCSTTRGLVERARRGSASCCSSCTRPLVERYEIVREVRGLGLMWAIELGPPAGRAGARAVAHGRARASRGCSPSSSRCRSSTTTTSSCQVAGHAHERRQGAARRW